MGTWFLTTVALSLPLSALWAASSLDGSSQANSRANNYSGNSSSRLNTHNNTSRTNGGKSAMSEKSGGHSVPASPVVGSRLEDRDLETGHGHVFSATKT
jgi:hypothetical protein